MSYGTLADAVTETTQNMEPTFVLNIPSFIALAERQILSAVKTPAMRAVGSVSIAAGTTDAARHVAMPTGFLDMISLSITPTAGAGTETMLLQKSYAYIKALYPTAATTGVPKYYAIGSSTTDTQSIYIAPTPNVTYTATVEHTAFPASLTPNAPNSWLDTNFPMVLQYATILHAYVYMKGSADVMAYYKGAYDVALEDMKRVLGVDTATSYRD